MKKQRKDAIQTKHALIEAACDIFAEKGYHDVTIAEICKKANVNVAAVNYHFGNKENLYRESWEYSFDRAVKKYPPDGGISEKASAEKRLKGRIDSLINKILDNEFKAFAIVQRELAKPTGLLKRIIKDKMEPIHTKMDALVKELLGDKASDIQIYFCKNSILAQCFHLLMMKKIAKIRDWAPIIKFNEIDGFADHIYNFSIAGIKALKKEIIKNKE